MENRVLCILVCPMISETGRSRIKQSSSRVYMGMFWPRFNRKNIPVSVGNIGGYFCHPQKTLAFYNMNKYNKDVKVVRSG